VECAPANGKEICRVQGTSESPPARGRNNAAYCQWFGQHAPELRVHEADVVSRQGEDDEIVLAKLCHGSGVRRIDHHWLFHQFHARLPQAANSSAATTLQEEAVQTWEAEGGAVAAKDDEEEIAART